MILEMIASSFAVVYLILILEIIFTSTKTVMYKQQAFEGRLLFFIYSLLVYYNNIRFNIFLIDSFLNKPIIQAYQLLDTFLASFFGVSIANDPWAVFLYVIPASFVYHFTNYWFRYGFGDRRIGRMAGFLAVVLFLSSGGLGLINALSVPFAGVPFFSILMGLALTYLPTPNLTAALGIGPLRDFGGAIMYVVFYIIVCASAILLYFFGGTLLKWVAEHAELSKWGLAVGVSAAIAVGLSFAFVPFLGFLLYRDLNPFNPLVWEKLWNIFVSVLFPAIGLALLAEVIVFLAIYMMVRNFQRVFGS